MNWDTVLNTDSMRTADVFPVVGREATTGNTSAVRGLKHSQRDLDLNSSGWWFERNSNPPAQQSADHLYKSSLFDCILE